MKQAYYYTFYVLYKREQKSITIFSYDFLSSLYMIIIGILLISSFTNYYNVIFYTNSGVLSKKIWIIIVMVLFIFDYILLHYKDQWKYVVKEFDKLPDEKIKKNKKIVYSFIILIITNFIFSFYVLFAQAKRNQTGPYAPEFVAKERREDSLQKAQQIENLKKIYGEDNKK